MELLYGAASDGSERSEYVRAEREKGTNDPLDGVYLFSRSRAYNDILEISEYFRALGRKSPGEVLDVVGWINRRLRRDREDGAALVEFAVVLPLFIVLIFGIMEAGWFFAQHVEVRNAAREGARLAAVDYPTPGSGDEVLIVSETCSRAPLSNPTAIVSLAYDNVEDTATATVTQTYSSLTGLIDFFDGDITSTVVMRYERDDAPTWANLTDEPCP